MKHEVSTDEFIDYLMDDDGIQLRETDGEWSCFGESLKGNPQLDIFVKDSSFFVPRNWYNFITLRDLPLLCSMPSYSFLVAEHYMPHFNSRQFGFVPYLTLLHNK